MKTDNKRTQYSGGMRKETQNACTVWTGRDGWARESHFLEEECLLLKDEKELTGQGGEKGLWAPMRPQTTSSGAAVQQANGLASSQVTLPEFTSSRSRRR